MIKSSIYLLLFFVLSSFCFGCSDDSSHNHEERQSELYIKGFKTQYDAMSAEEQRRIKEVVEQCADELDKALANEPTYRAQKIERIDSLRHLPTSTPQEEYGVLEQLFEEYFHLSFDSTFVVSHQMLNLAEEIGDKDLIANARIHMSKMYISGGFFREADHAINDLNPDDLSREMYIKWMMARFALEYENGFFFSWRLYSPDEAHANMEKLYNDIMPLLPDDSYEMYRLKTSMTFSEHKFKEGANYGAILLMKTPKNTMQHVVTLGDIGFNKMGYGDFDGGMKSMTESAIMGIQKGSNNYSAIRKIAELMYVVGDVDRASRYIEISMDNATAYNSKYRIIESSKGYPLIIHQLQEKEREAKNLLKILIVVLCAVIVALICAEFYIHKQKKLAQEQTKRIERRNKSIEEKNAEIEEQKRKIEQKNKRIEAYNLEFQESHAIAGQLMGRMIAANALCLTQIDKLKKKISQMLKVRQTEGMLDAVDACKKNLKSVFPGIDESLLAFFPNFAQQFNDIFPEGAKFEIPRGQKLSTEMRIFALWRLGIKKNEDIAGCLDYSLNTIKTYKTKIISASGMDKDEFYSRVMEIELSYDAANV